MIRCGWRSYVEFQGARGWFGLLDEGKLGDGIMLNVKEDPEGYVDMGMIRSQGEALMVKSLIWLSRRLRFFWPS